MTNSASSIGSVSSVARTSPAQRGLLEYFTQRSALALLAKIDDPSRRGIADALAVGEQKAEAAETLWSNGHATEGLRLAIESLEESARSAPVYAKAFGLSAPASPEVVAPEIAERVESGAEDGSSEAEPSEAGIDEGARLEHGEPEATSSEAAPLAPSESVASSSPAASPAPAMVSHKSELSEVLAARGVSSKQIAMVESALEDAKRIALPRLDGDVTAAHEELYQKVRDARLVIQRALRSASKTRRELLVTRAFRIATVATLSIGTIFGLYFALRTPEGLFATASATFQDSADFQASNVVDGQPATEWLLPDRSEGWVEVRVSPPRRIEKLRLLNGTNPPWHDRATTEYRVEIYRGAELAQTVEGRFTFSQHPDWVEHEVGVDAVDRVRFVAVGHHNNGAALAEIALE